jgi:hypothetical protein
VTGIAPDEESIAPANGNSNKEHLVQKEMCRQCGIVMVRTAMPMISLWWSVLPFWSWRRARQTSFGSIKDGVTRRRVLEAHTMNYLRLPV